MRVRAEYATTEQVVYDLSRDGARLPRRISAQLTYCGSRTTETQKIPSRTIKLERSAVEFVLHGEQQASHRIRPSAPASTCPMSARAKLVHFSCKHRKTGAAAQSKVPCAGSLPAWWAHLHS